MTILPDIITIQLFVAAVEEGSIARAARRERIAASAISKRISEMEQRLGVTLLRRHASGVEMTAAGAAFLTHAKRILQESSQLESTLREQREGVHGLVRVVAGETTLVDYLPSVLGPFLTTHPAIRVELDERHHAEVLRAVRDQVADIGIWPGETVPGGSRAGLWHRPCYRDRLLAVMRRDHPLALYPGVTMAELLDHDIIGQDRRGALGALLRRQAEALGRSMRTRIAADGWDIVYRLVQEGLGVGIVAESSLRLFAPDPTLVSLPVLDAWARRQHRVCVRHPDDLSDAARLLLEQLLPQGT